MAFALVVVGVLALIMKRKGFNVYRLLQETSMEILQSLGTIAIGVALFFLIVKAIKAMKGRGKE